MLRTAGILALLGLLAAGCGQKQDPLGPGASIDEEVSYGARIAPILDANCIGCHSSTRQGAARNGAPVGVDFDSYPAAAANAERANVRIQAGSMPLGGSLSAEQKALFQAWVDQGTPE